MMRSITALRRGTAPLSRRPSVAREQSARTQSSVCVRPSFERQSFTRRGMSERSADPRSNMSSGMSSSSSPRVLAELHSTSSLRVTDLAVWLHGSAAAGRQRDGWHDVVHLHAAIVDGDASAAAYALRRGLNRRAWAGAVEDAPVFCYLAAASERAYWCLADIDVLSGAGGYPCVGTPARPGCMVVFQSSRAATWCPACQKKRVPGRNPREVQRWADRWDPSDRDVIRTRLCVICDGPFTPSDAKHLACSSTCRSRQTRAA